MHSKTFTDPFLVGEKNVLYCLSSGVPASVEVENELLTCQALGISAFTTFLKERLIDKAVSFYAPLKMPSLKTVASMKKSKKLTSLDKKIVEIKAERNIFGQLVLLSKDNNISIERALTYPLGPVPWQLATADGSPMNTDKAKILHHLEGEISHSERPNLSQASYIYDGNALFQSLTNLPNTFEELAEKVFTALPKTERIDFVTDTYKENSIKNAERSRRVTQKNSSSAVQRQEFPGTGKASCLITKIKLS